MKQFDYETVYKMYIKEGHTVKYMCEYFSISRDKFFSEIKKLGIRKNGTSDINCVGDKVKDREWLEEKFKRMSASTIAKELCITEGKVEYWLKKHGIKQHFKYGIDDSKLTIDDPVFCYWGGLVATDGHLDRLTNRVTVSLSEESSSTLQAIVDYFDYGGYVYEYEKRKILCISSTKMISELEKLGIFKDSNKTFEVSTPNSFSSNACRAMYLRGCMDGDGNIKKDKGVARLYCGSLQFVTGLVNILGDIGIDTNVKYARKKYPGFELTMAQSLHFLKYIYDGFDSFRLQRKFDIAYGVWGDDIV